MTKTKTQHLTSDKQRDYARKQWHRNADEAKELSAKLGVKITPEQMRLMRCSDREEKSRRDGAKYWTFLQGKEFAGKSLAELALVELNSIRDVFKQEHLTAEQASNGEIAFETLRAGARGYVLTACARYKEKAVGRGNNPQNPGFKVLEELGV